MEGGGGRKEEMEGEKKGRKEGWEEENESVRESRESERWERLGKNECYFTECEPEQAPTARLRVHCIRRNQQD